MDKEVAREIVRSVFSSGRELERLLPLLKERCSESDYVAFRRNVAKAIDGIQTSLLREVLDRFPELAVEIEANIAATGRAMP